MWRAFAVVTLVVLVAGPAGAAEKQRLDVTLTLHSKAFARVIAERVTDDGPCSGTSFRGARTADLTEGAQVTIKNAAGKIVGATTLKPGVVENVITQGGGTNFDCTFRFKAKVPPGKFWTVAIGSQPPVTISRADAKRRVLIEL